MQASPLVKLRAGLGYKTSMLHLQRTALICSGCTYHSRASQMATCKKIQTRSRLKKTNSHFTALLPLVCQARLMQILQGATSRMQTAMQCCSSGLINSFHSYFNTLLSACLYWQYFCSTMERPTRRLRCCWTFCLGQAFSGNH